MSLQTQQDLSDQTSFINRVCQAAMSTALNVASETGNANHVTRNSYANKVLNNPDGNARILARVVVADGANYAPNDAATDTLISNRLSAIWNAMAGV